MTPTREQVIDYIRGAAPGYGVDADLIIRQCEAESSFRQDVVSPCGAIGLMQLMPPTAAWLKVDPHDWQANLNGGMLFMRRLLMSYERDPAKALAAYNCGPGRLAALLEVWGDEWQAHLPAETRAYIGKILG